MQQEADDSLPQATAYGTTARALPLTHEGYDAQGAIASVHGTGDVPTLPASRRLR